MKHVQLETCANGASLQKRIPEFHHIDALPSSVPLLLDTVLRIVWHAASRPCLSCNISQRSVGLQYLVRFKDTATMLISSCHEQATGQQPSGILQYLATIKASQL